MSKAQEGKEVDVERAFAALGKLQKRTTKQELVALWDRAASDELWPGIRKSWRPLGDFVRGEYAPLFKDDYIEDLVKRYRDKRAEHFGKSGKNAGGMMAPSARKIVITIARLIYLEKLAEEVCRDGSGKPEHRALKAIMDEFDVSKSAAYRWFEVKPKKPA